MTAVTFIDTSVLCELLQVPGKSSPERSSRLKEEMDRRFQEGERFVLPVTTVIETGNHIAQCEGDRFRVATRLALLLRMAIEGESPWLVLQTIYDSAFLAALNSGDSTGRDLATLAAMKVGAGDVALLVERDAFVAGSAVGDARVWTLDENLASLAAAG